jgi:hypothetical protein
MTDLKIPKAKKYDFLNDALKIFLHNSNRIVAELHDDTLRISKSNTILKFFATTSDTMIMQSISEINDVRFTEDIMYFYVNNKNKFSIGRDKCYFNY